MGLCEKIKTVYPVLNDLDFDPIRGSILLQNNSDGKGDYIAKWEHPTLAKPTAEQLA
jgi:hypothetical protein